MLYNIFNKKNNKSFFARFLSERLYQERCGGKLTTNGGFSLLEVLIYVSTLVLGLAIVSNTFLLMSKSYLGIKVSQNINNSAVSIIERMSREIRWSDSVNSGNSVFGSDSGVLALNTIDDLGVAVEKKFYIEGGVFKIKEGLEEAKDLSSGNVQINKLFLTLVDSGVSKMIKIETEIEGTFKGKTRTKTFYNSVVMREGY